jgi:hypothetical protein
MSEAAAQIATGRRQGKGGKSSPSPRRRGLLGEGAAAAGAGGGVKRCNPSVSRCAAATFPSKLGEDGEEFDEAFTHAALLKAESLGRPIGSREWLEDMEARTGQKLLSGRRGPNPKPIKGLSHLSP